MGTIKTNTGSGWQVENLQNKMRQGIVIYPEAFNISIPATGDPGEIQYTTLSLTNILTDNIQTRNTYTLFFFLSHGYSGSYGLYDVRLRDVTADKVVGIFSNLPYKVGSVSQYYPIATIRALTAELDPNHQYELQFQRDYRSNGSARFQLAIMPH